MAISSGESRNRTEKRLRPAFTTRLLFRANEAWSPRHFPIVHLSVNITLMAPEAGLEPATRRLTAGCSTIELLWMPERGEIYRPARTESNGF